MSGAQSGQSLRAALAADPALRRKINEAVATAAYNVAKEAGITVTAADVEDARSTLPLASSAGQSGTQADTLTDAATIGSRILPRYR